MASRFRRRLVLLVLVIYAGFVLVITVSPRMPGSGLVGRVVYRALEALHNRGLFPTVDYLAIEFLGNILMFIPLGVFTALLVPRRAWWSLLILGTAFSGCIELFQDHFLPERVPEVRDLISNTTGFLIGAAFSLSLRLLVAHRDGLVEQDRVRAERVAAATPRSQR